MHEWLLSAKCKGLPPDFFYPTPHDLGSLKQAKQFCSDCPVRIECLEYALANHEDYGVWGGESERSRKRIRQTRVVARLQVYEPHNKQRVQERPENVVPLHLSCIPSLRMHNQESVVMAAASPRYSFRVVYKG